MTHIFKLTGVSKPDLFTCETKQGIPFKAKSALNAGRFDALFSYCKHHWDEPKYAKIKHSGYFGDGTPKYPVVMSVLTDLS